MSSEEKQVSCGSCNQSFQFPPSNKIPKVLPCLHFFCLDCTSRLPVNDGKVKCPTCSQEHVVPADGNKAFPTHYNAIRLLELITIRGKGVKCDYCEQNSASHKCVTCDAFFCGDHQKVHARHPRFSSHEFISLTNDLDLNRVILPGSALKCPTHEKEDLRLYCETCDQLICRDCTLTTHPQASHKFMFIKEAALKYRPELDALHTQVNGRVAGIDKCFADISSITKEMKTSAEGVRNQIRSETKEIVEAAGVREKRLLEQVEVVISTKTRRLNDQNTILQTIRADVLNSCAFTGQALQLAPTDRIGTGNGGELHLLSAKQLMKAHLESVDKLAVTNSRPFATATMELISANTTNGFEQLVKAVQSGGRIHSHGVDEAYGANCVTKFVKEVTEKQDCTIVIQYFNQLNDRVPGDGQFSEAVPEIELVYTDRKEAIEYKVNIAKDEKDNGANCVISYQPSRVGYITASVRVHGLHVKGSPFDINARPFVKFDAPTFVGPNIDVSADGRTATKTRGGVGCNASALCDTPNRTSYRIKLLASPAGGSHLLLGYAPRTGFQVGGQNYNKCGWYIFCHNGNLYGQGGVSNRRYHGARVTVGSIVEVRYDRAAGKISFSVGDKDCGVAFENVPSTHDLFPAIEFWGQGESVELLP